MDPSTALQPFNSSAGCILFKGAIFLIDVLMNSSRPTVQQSGVLVDSRLLEEDDSASGATFRRAGLHSFAGRYFFKGEVDLQKNSDGPIVVSLDAGLDSHTEWAESRARHQPYGSREKRGLAEGTLRALATAQALTAVCSVVGCSSLVHVQAARRQAKAAGRADYLPGDGCGSRGCSLKHRPGQFLSNQRSMASKLENGRRLLIAWPRGLGAREVVVQSMKTASAAAARARIERMRALKVARLNALASSTPALASLASSRHRRSSTHYARAGSGRQRRR